VEFDRLSRTIRTTRKRTWDSASAAPFARGFGVEWPPRPPPAKAQ
jgi:hypothetical protein